MERHRPLGEIVDTLGAHWEYAPRYDKEAGRWGVELFRYKDRKNDRATLRHITLWEETKEELLETTKRYARFVASEPINCHGIS